MHAAPKGNVVVPAAVVGQVVPVVMMENAASPASVGALTVRGASPALETNSDSVELWATLTLPNAGGEGVAKAVAANGTSCTAVQFLVTASLAVQKRRFSKFHSVSLAPSPFANGGPLATDSASATVTLPLAFGVTA